MKRILRIFPPRPSGLIETLVWAFAVANVAVICLAVTAGLSALVS